MSTRKFRTAAFLAAVFVLSATAPAATSRLAGELDAEELAARVAKERGRVVLVNFWASWCLPCREEFPALVRLQDRLGKQGLSIVGVSIDTSRQIPAVEKFLEEMRPSFPNYRKRSGGDDGEFIDAVEKSWGGELPFSVLYDRTGKKARVLSGPRTEKDFEKEIRAFLK
ncbi:MAG TPA: redoxin domain-containing protein [Thermoanaerobaculia bacterium]|jgi:thiol-disulfide isomerase/thioredoxin